MELFNYAIRLNNMKLIEIVLLNNVIKFIELCINNMKFIQMGY